MTRVKLFRSSRIRFAIGVFALGLALFAVRATPPVKSAPEPPPPSTPREFFNAGTQKLQQGKLREAESYFESALASQLAKLQPPALYNLGHTRFGQGVEELKKGPAAGPTAAHGRAAAQWADEASREADEALQSDNVNKMVAA